MSIDESDHICLIKSVIARPEPKLFLRDGILVFKDKLSEPINMDIAFMMKTRLMKKAAAGCRVFL